MIWDIKILPFEMKIGKDYSKKNKKYGLINL